MALAFLYADLPLDLTASKNSRSRSKSRENFFVMSSRRARIFCSSFSNWCAVSSMERLAVWTFSKTCRVSLLDAFSKSISRFLVSFCTLDSASRVLVHLRVSMAFLIASNWFSAAETVGRLSSSSSSSSMPKSLSSLFLKPRTLVAVAARFFSRSSDSFCEERNNKSSSSLSSRYAKSSVLSTSPRFLRFNVEASSGFFPVENFNLRSTFAISYLSVSFSDLSLLPSCASSMFFSSSTCKVFVRSFIFSRQPSFFFAVDCSNAVFLLREVSFVSGATRTVDFSRFRGGAVFGTFKVAFGVFSLMLISSVALSFVFFLSNKVSSSSSSSTNEGTFAASSRTSSSSTSNDSSV
mmetsp:Transcript_4315/g.13242  ORF Transcript_4315/g.13242 Transcript_4315/m.13242 type:complete len:351 (-) Transcript_4315:1722-2774(-)